MKLFLNICLALCVIPIAMALCLFYSYWQDPANELRNELLTGVEMLTIYSWPLWLAVTGLGLALRKQLKTYNLVLTQVPSALMALAYFTAIQI
jgi:hypothetical protein